MSTKRENNSLKTYTHRCAPAKGVRCNLAFWEGKKGDCLANKTRLRA